MATRSLDPATEQYLRTQIARIDAVQAQLSMMQSEGLRRQLRELDSVVARLSPPVVAEPPLWPVVLGGTAFAAFFLVAGALFYLFVAKG